MKVIRASEFNSDTKKKISKILISTALAFIILGKIITIIKKGKNDHSIPKDIGIVIGLLIVLISRLLR